MKKKHDLLKKYLKNDFKYGLVISSILFIGTTISSILNPGIPTLIESIIFNSTLSLTMGTLISGIIFCYINIYIPRKSIRILQKTQFKAFKLSKFQNNGEYLENLSGEFQSRIWWSATSPDNQKKSAINIFISCKVDSSKIEKISKNYSKQKIFFLETGILGLSEFFFTIPSYETMNEKLIELNKIAIENKFDNIKLTKIN